MKSWSRCYQVEQKITSAILIKFCVDFFLLIGTYIDQSFNEKQT